MTTVPKPIVVIYFPTDFSFQEGYGRIKPLQLMQDFNGWSDKIERRKNDPIDDYLWFCFFKENINEPEFKVFYSKDFTEIQYAELKKIIEDAIESQKQKPLQ